MGKLSSYVHASTLTGTELVPIVVTPGIVGGNAYITADEMAAASPLTERFAAVFTPERYGAIGNGTTDDTTAWQAAIDAAAAAGGGTVRCRAVVYAVGRVDVKSNVSIDLNGGTLLARAIVTSIIQSPGMSALGHVSVCAIRNGTIDLNDLANAGVWVKDVDRMVVENCVFTRLLTTSSTGIRLSFDTSNCVVRGNTILMDLDVPFGTVTSSVGISCESTTVDDQSGGQNNTLTFNDPTHLSEGHHISENRVYGGTHGISLFGAARVTVANNETDKQGHRGIIMSARASDCTISANTLRDFNSSGIHLSWGCRRNTISGNVLRTSLSANEADGIKGYFGCTDNTVTGNYIEGVTGVGLGGGTVGAAIRFAQSCSGNAITGNRIRGCLNGIAIQSKMADASYYAPTTGPADVGTVISGNSIDATGVGGTPTGIQLTEVGGINIRSLVLSGNTVIATTGIIITEATAESIKQLTGTGNSITATTKWSTSRGVGHFDTAAANVGLPDRAGEPNFTPGAVGMWYINPLSRATRTLAQTISQLIMYPVFSGPDGCTISDLDVSLTVVGAAGAVHRAGLWLVRDQGHPFAWTNGTIWADLLEAGTTVATDAGTGQKIFNITDTVIPPNTWFAVGGAPQVATPGTYNIEGVSGSSWWSPFGAVSGGSAGAGAPPGLALYLNGGATGAFTATFAPQGTINTGNGVGFKRSA